MVEANENGITVLAFMHYGIIEQYTNQKYEPVIKNAKDNAIALMNAGIRLVFTGHYHANSIVDFTNDGKILTDIETGSLVTPPYPYRIMTLDDNFINIDTRRVTSVGGECPDGADFMNYSDSCINRYMNGFFAYYLPILFPTPPIPDTLLVKLTPTFANGWLAYFAGDEKLYPAESKKINTLAQSMSPSLASMLKNIWIDLPPKDNKVHIKLK